MESATHARLSFQARLTSSGKPTHFNWPISQSMPTGGASTRYRLKSSRSFFRKKSNIGSTKRSLKVGSLVLLARLFLIAWRRQDAADSNLQRPSHREGSLLRHHSRLPCTSTLRIRIRIQILIPTWTIRSAIVSVGWRMVKILISGWTIIMRMLRSRRPV